MLTSHEPPDDETEPSIRRERRERLVGAASGAELAAEAERTLDLGPRSGTAERVGAKLHVERV